MLSSLGLKKQLFYCHNLNQTGILASGFNSRAKEFGLELTVIAKDGYHFPQQPGDFKDSTLRKQHYEFTMLSDSIVTPELLEKWRLSIPMLQDIVKLKQRIWFLIRLEPDAKPGDFGVKYFHEIPDAIIGMLPVS